MHVPHASKKTRYLAVFEATNFKAWERDSSLHAAPTKRGDDSFAARPRFGDSKNHACAVKTLQ